MAGVAAAQHGVISREQLLRTGLSDDAVDRAVGTGRLHRIFRGVYALGHPRIGERGRMMAATLACGDGTVVSHRSAAALLGLLDRAPAVIDVIAPEQRGRKIDGIRAHAVRPPRRGETGMVDGIPCTSPARTLVDFAGVVGLRSLRSAFERAAAARLLDIAAVEAAARPGGRRGIGTLRALIEAWKPAAPVAAKQRLKSPLEAKVLPLLTRRGLPMPRCNALVELVDDRIEVDFLWPEQRFVLEADSRDFHATEVAFERDRWRDRELLRVGFSTLRVTRRQAETEAAAIVDAICRRLGAQVGPEASQRRAIS
ncbi:MAG: type IV toxin-antitoxin system AbiEi family antitoxin domain-containing protein [Solirubrobacterales bacterium]